MGFIVIEGLDGSGKSTQLNLLREQLDKESVAYKYLHFPRLDVGVYGELIARFLRGEMGAIDQVDPYLVAILFAGDRSEAAALIREWTQSGFMVIADRYVYSNIAFQCAKLDTKYERQKLRDWILEFEFVHHKLPKPDINLYLNVPFEFTKKQLNHTRNGNDRAYLKGERDIHEESLEFQERVRQEYMSLRGYVDDLRLINCINAAGKMLAPEEISGLIVKQMEEKQ